MSAGYYRWHIEFQRIKSGDETVGGLLTFGMFTCFEETAEQAIATATKVMKQELGEKLAAEYQLVSVKKP